MYNLEINERYSRVAEMYQNSYGSNYQNDYLTDPIETSGKMSKVLEEILPNFISEKPHLENEMENLFERFKVKHFPELKENISKKVNSNDNLYNMFNAQALSGANSFTRSLSTKLGLFWEDIANLSSNVVSPEIEFSIKLKGVDAIVYHEGKIYFAQMKTQKNMLTGSQSGRSTSELEIYENSLFVACIDNNANWTYGGPIERIVGKQFWDMCNLDYNRILQNTEILIQEAEELLNE